MEEEIGVTTRVLRHINSTSGSSSDGTSEQVMILQEEIKDLKSGEEAQRLESENAALRNALDTIYRGLGIL